MVRVAVFGICPGGRKSVTDVSVDILVRNGHRVKGMSPFESAVEKLSGSPQCPAPQILEDVALDVDLKALANDLVVEMPYSFPWIFERDSVQALLTTVVEDKAIGKEFGLFFGDEKIKKYDAVIYIDLDSECLVGCNDVFGLSKKDIDDWKMFEKYRLRALCRRNNMLYSAFTVRDTLGKDIAKRVEIIIDSAR